MRAAPVNDCEPGEARRLGDRDFKETPAARSMES